MKITAADVVTSPDRNFVSLRLTTEDGRVGLSPGGMTAALQLDVDAAARYPYQPAYLSFNRPKGRHRP